MKKLRTKCLFVAFAACLAACSNDDATLNLIKGKEVASLETTNPVVESALKFVADIQKEEQHIAGTRSNLHALHVSKIDSVTVSSINSSITRTAKGDNTSLFTVNLSDNLGTVVLSKTDKEVLPLLYFKKRSDLNIQKLLKDSVSETSYIALATIERYLLASSGKLSKENQSTRGIAERDRIIERVYPKCKVRWHQSTPYSDVVNEKYNRPLYGNDSYLAGCTAVAAAQALSVLRPNFSWLTSTWDEMTAPNPSPKALRSIAELIEKTGSAAKTKYGTNASGADPKNLVLWFNHFDMVDYDAPHSIDVLKTPRGVILISGFQEKKKFLFFTNYSKGHAFIADGYIKYNRPDNPYYLHINYGWGEGAEYDDVYALNDNKWYDKKEAERLPYGSIYEFKMLYYCYAHASEKNW